MKNVWITVIENYKREKAMPCSVKEEVVLRESPFSLSESPMHQPSFDI
jgi:hypothetical protein